MKSKGRFNAVSIFVVIFILICSFSAFGISFTQETSGQWTKFGFDRYSSNSYVYPASIFTGELEAGENFTYTDTEIAGGNFQPIAFDWDSDGTVEIIAPVGTTLKVYNPSTNALVEESSYAMGGTMGVQGWCGTDATLGKYCVFNVGSNLVTLSYDGATVTSLGSASLGSTTISSAINCFSNTEYSIPYCFTIVDNTTQAKTKLVQYRADTDNDITFIEQSSGTDVFTQAKDIKPPISDIDYDGELEIVSYNYDPTNYDAYLLVYDWNSTSNNVALDTDFSSDGILKFIDSSSTITSKNLESMIVYDLDSADDEEICLLYNYVVTSPTYYVTIYCFNSDGSNFGGNTLHTYSPTGSSDTIGMVLSDYDGDSVQELVTLINPATNELDLFEVSGGSLSHAGTTSTGINTSLSGVLTSTQVNDDSYFDLIIDGYVFYSNGTTFTTFEDKNFVDNENIVPVNFNNDAVMDFVGQKLNSLSLYTSGTGGLPTVSTITLNTDLDDSGFYGYYPTVCKDSVAQYRALECVSGVFDSTCTYINTDTDATERIVASCGNGTTFGAYNGLNPYVNCSWEVAGTYNMYLYMQDVATSSYYGVSEAITITVVDGTEGIDCNVPSELITQPSDQTDTSTPETVDSVENFFNIFSYGSSSMKFVFGLVIILGMAVMGFSIGQSVFMAILFAVAGLMLTTILGLIPLWVILLMVLLMALPLIFKYAFGNNG